MVDDLEAWMRAERTKLSRYASVAKAMDYMLERWPSFTDFLDDSRIFHSNTLRSRGRAARLGERAERQV